MNRFTEPFLPTVPNAWTPEQVSAIHDFLDDLLVQIEHHYGRALQDWLAGDDNDTPPDNDQRDLFDFDDPLSF